MSVPTVTGLVEGVIERLQALTREQGRYLRTLDKAAGSLERMDNESFQDALRAMGAGAPAVFVAVDDLRGFQGTTRGSAWRAEAELLAYCVADHRRSLTDGRLDPLVRDDSEPETDPGLRGLYEDVFNLLAGWVPPLLNAGRLNPIRGTTRAVAASVTVWEWRFVGQVEIVGDLELDPPAPITSVRVLNDVRDRDGQTAVVIEEDLP